MSQNDLQVIQDEVIRLVQEEQYEQARQLIAGVAAYSSQAQALKQQLDEQIASNKQLEEQIEALQEPPLAQGIVLGPSIDDEKSVLIGSGSQRLEVRIAGDANIKPQDLIPGAEAWLNQDRQIVKVHAPRPNGEAGEVVGILDDNRIEVKSHGNEGTIVERISQFDEPLQIGDRVRIDPHLGVAFEKLPTQDTKDLELEEVPDVTYDDIGGLSNQVEEIRDAIELPYLYSQLFRTYNLRRPKGILLYGPPGCGKTLIAKAIANNLTSEIERNLKHSATGLTLLLHIQDEEMNEDALKVAYLAWKRMFRGQTIAESDDVEEEEVIPTRSEMEKEVLLFLHTRSISTAAPDIELKNIQKRLDEKTQAYFMSIKGPELLNKYVGETEHSIRKLFITAKRRASPSTPVIMFFDEIEALFRRRGSRISSDMESTIVPQFLSEIDGVESLTDVIIIGATNRQDLLDPAILRPGRLDAKIRIDRPDDSASLDILGKYLKANLPLAEFEIEAAGSVEAALLNIRQRAVEIIFSEESIIRVTGEPLQNQMRTFHCREFISGAMLENIVRRAKKRAVKREIDKGERGLQWDDLPASINEEFEQNKDQLISTELGIPEEGLEITVQIAGTVADELLNVWLQRMARPWRVHMQQELGMEI